MWKLLKESENWEEDEYQVKSGRGIKGETEEDLYLEIRVGNRKGYAEDHK